MKTYAIEGMSCQGCVQSLTRAVQRRLGDDATVAVRLDPGELDVPDNTDLELVAAAVQAAGFELKSD